MGSSFRSPMTMALYRGFCLRTLSMISLHTVAALIRFQALAASPPLREGQWFTNTLTVSPDKIPVTCSISRVDSLLPSFEMSTDTELALNTLKYLGLYRMATDRKSTRLNS